MDRGGPVWLLARPIAHRGLHGGSGAPENSLAAFRRAIAAGFSIELDVRLSSDAVPVVFHDETLSRLTGLRGAVASTGWERLRQARLARSGERIPSLEEVLERVAGRVPIVVEMKSGLRYADLCRAVLSAIGPYRGPLAVMSFDQRIVRWFRNHAPAIVCGSLIDRCGPTVLARRLGRIMRLRPDFLSCHRELFVRPETHSLLARTQLPLLAWTVRSAEQREEIVSRGGNITFEGFDPR